MKLKTKNCYTRGCNGIVKYYNMPPSKYCKECYFERERAKFEKHKLTKVYQKEVKQEKEKLRKKCVKLAKDIAKDRDNRECQYCGNGERQIHGHHILNEGMYKSMSADPDNIIALCAIHHSAGPWGKSPDGFSFHTCPSKSTRWLEENIPERYGRLLERGKIYQKLDIFYWENKLKKLKEYKLK